MILSRLRYHRISLRKISLGVQNISPFLNGAYTGEQSVDMIKDYKCSFTLIGHSERRHILLEDEDMIMSKVKLSLQANLNTILCVGETLKEYNQKLTKKVISWQLRSALSKSTHLFNSDLSKVIIAYEPVWSIGTGVIPQEAALIQAISFIKSRFVKKYPKILYGGSVNTNNVSILKKIASIDGFLIGGASQNPKKFIDIIKKTIN